MRARIVPMAELFVAADPRDAWIREATNQNDGPWVEAIQRLTGNRRGDAWCASFCCLVLDLAYRGANPLPRTASCDVLMETGRARRWLFDAPEPGDLFLVVRQTPARVESVDASGTKLRLAPAAAGAAAPIARDGAAVGFHVAKRGAPALEAARILQSAAAPQAVRLATRLEVRGGDVVVLRDAVHVGVVTAVSPVAVKTIEGNTNAGGAREGWGVFARERPRAGLCFLRIPDQVPAEVAGARAG